MLDLKKVVRKECKGIVDPGKFSVERIPGTNHSLIRLYQNVATVNSDEFKGFEYDEYYAQNAQDNYGEFLEKGFNNEVDRGRVSESHRYS